MSRLSRDKVNVVARAVSEALAQMDDIEFIEDKNTIRLEVRKIMEELLAQEEKIDAAARQRSKARSAPLPKVPPSGTSCTASTITTRSRSSASNVLSFPF